MVFELDGPGLEAIAEALRAKHTISFAGHEYDVLNCAIAADSTMMKVNLVIISHDDTTAAAFQISGAIVRNADPLAELKSIYSFGANKHDF